MKVVIFNHEVEGKKETILVLNESMINIDKDSKTISGMLEIELGKRFNLDLKGWKVKLTAPYTFSWHLYNGGPAGTVVRGEVLDVQDITSKVFRIV